MILRDQSTVVSRNQSAWRAWGWLLLVGALASAPQMHAQSATALSLSATPFPLTAVGQTATQNVTLTVNAGGNSLTLSSIAPATGFTDYTVTASGTCLADGSTVYSDGQSCTIAVTFTPVLPGVFRSPSPISRNAPLIISYVDNETRYSQTFGLQGSATAAIPVLSPGTITDIVGNDQLPASQQSGFAGDGVDASQAIFNGPSGMAVDQAGNIYIADSMNCIVRRVDAATHQISTVAGMDPSDGYSICGGGRPGYPATTQTLGVLGGIALDAAGNLYIADYSNSVVWQVPPGPGAPLLLFAGSLSLGFSGDGGPATSAKLFGPTGISVDGSGNLYIVDAGNYAVREVSNGIIHTIAGTPQQYGSPSSETLGGPPTSFAFGDPVAVTTDSTGKVYISDYAATSLFVVDTTASTINAVPNFSAYASSIAFDAGDTLHYTARNDCNVYALPSSASVAIVQGGSGTCTASGDGGAATAAGLSNPIGVVPDSAGNLYVLEQDGVRFVNQSTPVFAATFGSVLLGNTPQQAFYVFNGDIASSSSQLQVADSGALMAPFAFVSPFSGADCSQGTSGSPLLLNGGGFCSLNIQFSPQSIASYSQSTILTEVSAAGVNSTQTIAVTGTGSGDLPTVILTPTSASFGEGINDGSATQAFTLKNTGDGAPFSVNSIAINSGNDGFSIASSTCPQQLAQNADCIITVAFTPVSAGSVSDSLIVRGNNQPGFISSMLSGNGITATATVMPASISVSAQVGGPAVNAGMVTVTNSSSTGPLAITSVGFGGSGVSKAFSYTNNCPASLQADTSCTLTVFYQPTTTTAANVSLVIGTDSTTGSYTVMLNGTPLYPVISVTPSSLTFAATAVGTQTAPQNVIFSNNGTGPLTFSSLMLTGYDPNDYTLDTSSCANGVAAGSTCTAVVTFKPAAPGGTLDAALQAVDNAGTQTVSITGSSPAATQTDLLSASNTIFPSSDLGQPMSQTVTVTLNSAGVVLKSIAIANTPSDFAITSISGCSIDGATANAAGTTCSVAITFTPSAPGQRIDILLVTTVESGSPIPYGFPLQGAATGAIAALTPGILSDWLSGRGGSEGGLNPIGGMGGTGALASTGYFAGMAADTNGNLYVADSYFDVIYKIDSSDIVRLYAGIPFTTGGLIEPDSGDGGPALNAHLGFTGPLAIGPSGALVLGDAADDYNVPAIIRRIDPATTIITTVAGNGAGCPAASDVEYDGCSALDAIVATGGPGSGINAMAFDSGGTLYFAERDVYQNSQTSQTVVGHSVRKIDGFTGTVSLVAGTLGEHAGTGALPGNAIGAAITPAALATDSNNLLYIATGNHVYQLTYAGQLVLYAGAGGPNTASGDGGAATAAGVGLISSITFDAANNLYIVDSTNCQVRRADSASGLIFTVAGAPLNTNCQTETGDSATLAGNDGAATLSYLQAPLFIQLDSFANLYIGGQRDVRKVDTSRSVSDFSIPYPAPLAAGGEEGPLTVQVVNAGVTDTLSFAAPFITPTQFGIDTTDFTRDTSITDCIAAGTLAVGTECTLASDFTPTGNMAVVNDTQTLTDNGARPTQAVALLGQTNGTAPVTLLPHLLSFTTALQTTSAAQTLTLTNNSGADLPITSITVSGPGAATFSQTNNCPATLSSGGTCTFQVVFTPPSQGQFEAIVTVADTGNGAAATQVASLAGSTGTADASLGTSVTFSALNFGSQAVNTTSQPLTATLNSTGTGTLLISSIAITGTDAQQFAITSTTCGAALAAQASCQINLTFTPLSISPGSPPAPFQAYITVTDNAPAGTQRELLEGIGTAAPLLLSINETITTSDAPSLNTGALLAINETVAATDATQPSSGALLNINEQITTSDAERIAGTAVQAIHFSATPANVQLDSSGNTLVATATSGLPVTFRVISGPGVINGNQLKATNFGTIVVEADQPGNGTYAAAPPVQRSIPVLPFTSLFDVGLGTQPSGQAGPATPVILLFTTSGTLNSLSVAATGSPGSDFTITAGTAQNACVLGVMYQAGTSCTASVVYTPSTPELVLAMAIGADGNGQTLASAQLISLRYR